MEMVKHSVDSRRRSLLLISFVVLICFAFLGYIYNFSRTNRLLITKHEALTISYQSCRNQLSLCDNERQTLLKSGMKLQESEKKSIRELDAKKIEMAEGRSTVESKTKEITDLKRSMEKQKTQLADVQKNLEETKINLSRANKLNVGILKTVNISMANVTEELQMSPELENSLITEIAKLKSSSAEHQQLVAKYALLLGNHNQTATKLAEKGKMANLNREEVASASSEKAKTTETIKVENKVHA